MKRIAVVGSRSFTDAEFLHTVLDRVREKYGPFQVISGGAPGVDSLAVVWANKYHDNPIPLVFPAEWGNLSLPGCVVKTRRNGEKYNATAGFYRNQTIVDNADLVLAFMDWDNPTSGTMDTINKGLARGIPVWGAFPGRSSSYFHEWSKV